MPLWSSYSCALVAKSIAKIWIQINKSKENVLKLTRRKQHLSEKEPSRQDGDVWKKYSTSGRWYQQRHTHMKKPRYRWCLASILRMGIIYYTLLYAIGIFWKCMSKWYFYKSNFILNVKRKFSVPKKLLVNAFCVELFISCKLLAY